ncbi:MAG: hypothetical protein Q7R41_13045 [Phycisphaerales bacterium]|nr:hypothetical protein [Phycisphaerales bacterium]
MITTVENAISFTAEEPGTVTESELRTRTSYVRAISFYSDPPDLTTTEIMQAIEASGTLDFWNDPEEDIYNEQDGNDV